MWHLVCMALHLNDPASKRVSLLGFFFSTLSSRECWRWWPAPCSCGWTPCWSWPCCWWWSPSTPCWPKPSTRRCLSATTPCTTTPSEWRPRAGTTSEIHSNFSFWFMYFFIFFWDQFHSFFCQAWFRFLSFKWSTGIRLQCETTSLTGFVSDNTVTFTVTLNEATLRKSLQKCRKRQTLGQSVFKLMIIITPGRWQQLDWILETFREEMNVETKIERRKKSA